MGEGERSADRWCLKGFLQVTSRVFVSSGNWASASENTEDDCFMQDTISVRVFISVFSVGLAQKEF